MKPIFVIDWPLIPLFAGSLGTGLAARSLCGEEPKASVAAAAASGTT